MKSIKVLVVVFLGMLALTCEKPEDGSYVEPITIYEKMQGDWNLTNLRMVDQFAKANAIEPSEQNLSALFNFDVLKMAFNVDAQGQPSTYAVTGNVPPIFELSGYWALNTSFQPTNSGAIQIHLYSDAQKTQRTDTLLLTSVPGSNNKMEVQLVRTSGGTAFVSYVFTLISNI